MGEEQCAEQPAEDGSAGHDQCAHHCEEEEEEDELSQRETPLGLDPTATPSYVQHLAAFQAQLRQVDESCRKSHKLQERIVCKDDIESTTAAAAAEEKVQRKIIDLLQAAQSCRR